MTSAFRHGPTGAPLVVDGAPYFGQRAVLAMGNLAGLPALVAPSGQDDDEGLPIGVQMIAARWSEMRLVNVCRALESAGVLPELRPPGKSSKRRCHIIRGQALPSALPPHP